MAERIDTLTTRAGAVTSQAAELRRIERDLHDGAQARLVALAMDLGMARSAWHDAPAETRALVDHAHEHAKPAIAELRDLACGASTRRCSPTGASRPRSRPGATAASRWTSTCRRPPRAGGGGGGRLLHRGRGAHQRGQAQRRERRVRIGVARRGTTMCCWWQDDGAGGADPRRDGLAGLRHRVEAVDGTLTVDSPPGAAPCIERSCHAGRDRRGLVLLRDGLTRLLREIGHEVVAAVEAGGATGLLTRGRA